MQLRVSIKIAAKKIIKKQLILITNYNINIKKRINS